RMLSCQSCQWCIGFISVLNNNLFFYFEFSAIMQNKLIQGELTQCVCVCVCVCLYRCEGLIVCLCVCLCVHVCLNKLWREVDFCMYVCLNDVCSEVVFCLCRW